MARKAKAAPQTRDIASIVNNSSDKAKLKGFIDESLLCYSAIADKNQDIKALREEAVLQLGIDAKLFSNIVRVFRTDSFDKAREEMTELEIALEMLGVEPAQV